MTSGPLPTEPAGEPTGEGPTGRPAEAPRDRALAALRACGVEPAVADGAAIPVTSPIDGEEVAALEGASAADAIAAAARAATAFTEWRTAAPESRAAAVTAIAAALDRYAPELADLITIETGKPLTAARAEVGAAVDACASAATTAQEVAALPATASPAPPAAAFRVPMQTGRFAVRRPLGPVAVLGSAELPLLDWATAAPPALACGDPVVWLPGAPLVATAVAALVASALAATGWTSSTGSAGLHSLVLGEADAAEALAGEDAIALTVRPPAPAANVAIAAPGADLDLVAREALAVTVAGAGRSSAALRLLLVHESLVADLERRLGDAIAALQIGDPLDSATALGPLPDLDAYRDHLDAVQSAEAEGGELLAGGEDRDLAAFSDAYFAEPALVRLPAAPDPATLAAVRAPVLFLASYADLEEALAHRDAMPRSWSALLGGDAAERSRFLAALGSDRGFVALGTCPTEAEVAAATAPDWRVFTQPVAGRVD